LPEQIESANRFGGNDAVAMAVASRSEENPAPSSRGARAIMRAFWNDAIISEAPSAVQTFADWKAG
jgi:hypothetical protein